MSYTEKIIIETKGICDVVNLTPKIEKIVEKSEIKDGLVNIFITGSTAGLTTIEYEENLLRDFKEMMERLIPQKKSYYHDQTWGEANGFSHLRASLIGPEVTIPLEEGKILLGSWQQIVLCDFDRHPRTREVIVTIISG